MNKLQKVLYWLLFPIRIITFCGMWFILVLMLREPDKDIAETKEMLFVKGE